MTYLLDTNVISELTKPRPNAGVIAWLTAHEDTVLSAVTVEEIRYGVVSRNLPALLRWADNFFPAQTILLVDANIARQSGTLRGELRRRGNPRSQADMLIAATAQAHNLTLVTRNTRDFENCGIGLLNPFTD
jgi:predicted nucleic acid-binding protein